jgi:D-arginine dehydrogenase
MDVDFIVVGGGMAGASVGYALAEHASVAIVEAEAAPGHHSTGRSASLFMPHYGGPVVRRLIHTGWDFFKHPPAGFSDVPLLQPRGLLTLAGRGDEAGLEAVLADSSPAHPVCRLSSGAAVALAPLLRVEDIAAAAYEPDVMDIDVDGLHRGYLRGFRARGGHVLTAARIDALEPSASGWRVRAGETERFGARLVNAAGAWADQIGRLAGAAPIGLTPKRRTAILVDAPVGLDVAAMPAVDTVGTPAYFKPDAGRIMASLGDETPTEPQDAQPEEMDVALTADWLERRTTLQVRRIQSSWAGLRSFVADGDPVVGFDPRAPNFFWLAGQGGYGIMMAPALARIAAGALLGWQRGTGGDDLAALAACLSPNRLL